MGHDPRQETSIARTKFRRPCIPSVEIKSDFEFIDVARTKYLFHRHVYKRDDLIPMIGRCRSNCIFVQRIKIETSKIGKVRFFIFKNSFIHIRVRT